MPKKDTTVDDFVLALQSEAVKAAIGSIFSDKLKELLDRIQQQEAENVALKAEVKNTNIRIITLTNDVKAADMRISLLENYNRRDNLTISGLKLSSYAEAASFSAYFPEPVNNENSTDTENAVLRLCQDNLSLQIQHSDISIAHRLPSKKKDLEPNIIVRFTNSKARDMVLRARGQLKSLLNAGKIYINKDPSKDTAQLFRQARGIVKAKTLHAAWTDGGMFHVKTSPDCKATRINC